jgi:hypothetical protein
VLLSGFGNAADIWQVALAHPPSWAAGVATFTRVCGYDRPGSYIVTVEQNGSRVEATSADQYKGARGNAVASPTPGTGAPVVADLHHLLEAAGVKAPTSSSATPSAGSSPSCMPAPRQHAQLV